MKTKTTLLSLLLVLIGLNSVLAQVGIGTSNPDNAAALDITATNKGFLPPRMTAGQLSNISNPPAGLTVWCSNCGSKGEMQVYNGTEWTNMIGGAVSLPPQVGDYREGGVVFYIFQNGDPGYVVGETNGLVCAIQDQSGSIKWSYGSNTTTGATATGIGTGQSNTNAIINNQGTGTYAASVCNDYSVTIGATTYDDWFLPSKDELILIYQNKGMIDAIAGANAGSSFVSSGGTAYWSSTEDENFDWAWVIYFDNGGQFQDPKQVIAPRVRAVRAF